MYMCVNMQGESEFKMGTIGEDELLDIEMAEANGTRRRDSDSSVLSRSAKRPRGLDVNDSDPPSQANIHAVVESASAGKESSASGKGGGNESSAGAGGSVPPQPRGGPMAPGSDLHSALHDSSHWANCWRPMARKRAVLRGLDKIFSMAQSEDNFSLFGNDIIQCFYDVATVTGEPVRSRALMYVEQLAQRWKTTVLHVGWKQGEQATSQEIIDAIIGMYCLERVGIHDGIKVEVEASIGSYTARDYLGWDPMVEPPPDEVKDVYTGETVGCYRAMSNSIVNTFYADRVGLRLGCGYEEVFEWLSTLRPYRGPKDLKWRDYIDQCCLVAHVVFTLNSWGELRLNPELLPHEYLFVREHLSVQIKQRDVHLVGQFIEVLRVFGDPDSDPLVQAGITFLLAEQEEDGSWDRGEDRDDYTTYHATMVGVQALLAHNYRGSGPSITSLVPTLQRWYLEETLRRPGQNESTQERFPDWTIENRLEELDQSIEGVCSMLQVSAQNPKGSNRGSTSASSERKAQNKLKNNAARAVEEVTIICQDMEQAVTRHDWKAVEAIIVKLGNRNDIGREVLTATEVGRQVKKLRKAPNETVADLARRLVLRWRELVSAPDAATT